MSALTTSPGHDSDGPLTEPLPSVPAAAPLLTGFAAGITGAVLLVAGVWGLHALSVGGVSAGSVVLLLAAFTALGKGITLLQRVLAPFITAAAAPLSAVPPLVRALTATIAGAVGMWWVLRGHAASWWAQTTGTTEGWTLASALVQVAVIAAAGALLFGGAKSLAALWVRASGARHQGGAGADRPRGERWAAWWSSRPGLGLMLLAGAAAIVIFSGYIVPRVTGWLLGGDLKAALAAIVAVLAAGLVANTWWWGALSGWWAWADRPHTPGGGASPMSQMHAGAAVVALLWFSATAFGLAVPDSYSGPGAMPRARADCPPDCGGSGGSGSFGPDPSQFQPPQMPNPPSQYQGGANSGYPGPDQGNGISLYNPATGQSGNPAQGGYPQYPQQGQPGPPANGVQPPNYDAPLQPQAPAPQQGAASPQQGSPPAQQAPAQQPGQAPQQPVQQPAGQQAPAQQGPQQPAQQSVQQPQGQPQPGQQNQPVHQGQPGQQNQPPQQVQQQPQNQQPTTPKKEPNSPVNPTDLAAAATRRGSQTAGQQATQTAGQQATQVTQQATQATQQSTQQATQTAQQPAQATQQQNTTPKPKQRTGFDEWANGGLSR